MVWESHGHFQQEDYWLPTKKLAPDHNSEPKSLLCEAPVCGLRFTFLVILGQC